MTLREMRKLLNENLPKIRVSAHGAGNGNLILRPDLSGSVAAIRELQQIPFLTASVDSVLVTPRLGNALLDEAVVDQATGQQFQNAIASVLLKAKLMQEVLTELLPQDTEQLFLFKLPEMKTFEEFAATVKELNDKIDGLFRKAKINLEVDSLDVGSKWVNIAVRVGLGMHLMTAVINKGFDLYHYRFQKVKAMEIVLTNLSNEAELVEKLRKKTLEDIEAAKNAQSADLMNELSDEAEISKMTKEDKEEFRNSAGFAIKSMSELIEKGLEVYKAIPEPPENTEGTEGKKIEPLVDFKKKAELLQKNKEIAGPK